MTSCLILTAADAKFFHLVKGTLLSIQQKPQAKAVSLGFFDLGCTQEQLQWLGHTVDLIRVPDWEFEFPTRSSSPSYFKGLLARPHLRRYFPDFDIYIWIDADAWVQQWTAVELLMQGAQKRGLAIIPEVDRGNRLLYGLITQEPQDVHYHLYKRIYDEEVAQRLQARPIMNAGVFALHKNAPHWDKWAEYLGQGLQKYASLWTDQMALNRTIYDGDLFEQTELLPAWCNWTCHYGLPAWDPIKQVFVEPYLPHMPIGILHLTSNSKDQSSVPVASTQGGRVEKSLHYPIGPEGTSRSSYDYISPGFKTISADAFFPNMIPADVETCRWSYLRREIPHLWYVDQRFPSVGFVSRDEAHILYNTALKFSGQHALEIGCWMGWSACHLALGGVQLDIVDPMLEKPRFYHSVSSSLEAAGVLSSVTLNPGFSPAATQALYARKHHKWSLIFIDGDHNHPGPLQDAIVAETVAEPDALILFHDLASPDVAEGLHYLRQQGWNTMVYQTMQIMGVAWRGNVEPVSHIPDPHINWTLPAHLNGYLVSGSEAQLQIQTRSWESCFSPSLVQTLQIGIQAYTYKALPMGKSPFDIALYLKLIGQIRPKTIIEITSYAGGSPVWMADVMDLFGIEGHVYAIAIQLNSEISHPRITFLEGSRQYLEDVLTPEWLGRVPRPLVVIENADPAYPTNINVLEFFHDYLFPEDYIVIENGILDASTYPDQTQGGGANPVIKEFLMAHSKQYIIDSSCCDYYGHNATWNTNGYLKKVSDQRADQDLEFQELLKSIKPYTLLSVARLYSLYYLAKTLCQQEVPGNFVECGVYKGGAAALLATVIKRYSTIPRKIFAFDTYEGMPDPIEIDQHEGVPANQTGFGAGTLKAPIHENLERICQRLQVWDYVIPVQGLFGFTLPQYRDQIGSIALLHADGDWYESTIDIFSNLYDRVVDNGFIQIDDYGHWQGCRQAVHDFERHLDQFFVLHPIDYTGVWTNKSETLSIHRDTSSVAAEKCISLREINILLFPDWNQPQEKLMSEFETILQAIITHPDLDRMALIVCGELDYQQAESLFTAAATNLSISLLDQGIEIISEPIVNIVRDLNGSQWQSLLKQSSFLLELAAQRLPAGLAPMPPDLPAFSIHQFSEL